MKGYLSKPPPGIQLNRNHPLAQRLVGCWLFNEGSGLRANDLTGNNNTGVLSSFEPFSSTSGWTGGNTGTALMFDGLNNYVDCGNNPPLNITSDLTLEVWVSPSSSQAAASIISGGTTDANKPYEVRLINLALSFILGDGASDISITSLNTIPIDSFSQLLCTVSGTTMDIYINGVFNDFEFFVGTRQTLVEFIIGRFRNTDNIRCFNGKISLVRAWNRALNPTEIQNLYAQPYSMFNLG